MSASKSNTKLKRISEEKCREWLANPTVNPLSGNPIQLDGPKYNELKEICLRKYNVTLPAAAEGPFSRGNSPVSESTQDDRVSSDAPSSASVETKNKTAGWKKPVPTTKAAALKIVDLIAKQINAGIKKLVTAQNKDNVNGLQNVNMSKVFKNLPYYQPYIQSINRQEILDSPFADIRLMTIEGVFHKYIKAYDFLPASTSICGYNLERIRRLVDPNAPKVIVMLHKIFTFLQSMPTFHTNGIIQNILNTIQPHLAEAQRKVDNLNIALLLHRASRATQTPGADQLTTHIANLMLTRRPAAPAQGGKKKSKK